MGGIFLLYDVWTFGKADLPWKKPDQKKLDKLKS